MSFFKLLICGLFILVSSTCFAETRHYLLGEGKLIELAPPGVNKNYYLIEFGFVVPKKMKVWNYDYNAYVNAALFEDWKNRTDNLHAGALGFKGGVLLPIPGIPLFTKVGFGFAKSVLHKNPVFGKSDQSIRTKNMILLELGALYSFDKYFVSFTFQKSNVSFFERKSFLAFGVDY